MIVPQLGPQLPTFDPMERGLSSPASAAVLIEQLGFEQTWLGDHLIFHPPFLESTACLAAAAAVTSHIRLGFSVLLVALRQPVWIAKQLATLQLLASGRLVLGVGVGGENPVEWEVAGVPLRERGARTDSLLEALPDLLGGRPARVLGLEIPPLRPAVPMPPVWVGGRRDGALRRAARYGDGWLGAFLEAAEIPERRERLEAYAAELGRPAPAVGMSVFVNVTDRRAAGEEEAATFFQGLYRLPFERFRRFLLLGDEESVAEQIAAYTEVGVSTFVLVPVSRDPLAQYERHAAVRERMLAAGRR